MEYWDIYDKNRNLTGRTMKRNDFTMKDGDYHLTVLGVICRPDGKFLITQRALDKHWAAGWWEVSGGGVMAGETSEQAVIREVLEETGLDVPGAVISSAITGNPLEIIILSIFINLFLISMKIRSPLSWPKCRAICSLIKHRLKNSQNRESFCIMTASGRCLNKWETGLHVKIWI